MGKSSKNLVFIYRENAKNVASTYMRGYQLSELIKVHINNVNVSYFNEDFLNDVENSIVVLTKGFLKKVTLQEIAILKNNNNIVCVDFVDDPAIQWVVNEIDVLIASSISQSIYYKNQYPDKYTHMITHHVDPDISDINKEFQKTEIGYFGELLNAKWHKELESSIDFILTNTKTRSRDWIGKLSSYNVHYAVRQRRNIDGFKPFLKGFTAARCGACIIVPDFEGDSRYYLTHDYPFLLKNDDLDSVREMIEKVKISYGSSTWKLATDIMADVRYRSTDKFIADEVKSLLLQFIH